MNEWAGWMNTRVNARAEAEFELKCLAILALQLCLVLVLLPHTPVLAQGSPDNRLEVALRAVDGTGVAGVTVTLAPRPAELGGPTDATPERSAVTNAGGWVAFDKVPAGIWLLSFAGSAQGLPLQPQAKQGRPPYGTTADGGGFLVSVNSEAGDDIGTDSNDTGGAGSSVIQALFVGRAQDAFWVPEYDLSDPSNTPAPLSRVSTPEPLSAVPTLDVSGASGAASSASTATPAASTTTTARLPVATATPMSAAATANDRAGSGPLRLTPLLLCYAPGLLLGLVLLGRAWLLRRRASEGRG